MKSITIDPEAVDPEDVEMLQDMVLAATNEALRSAQELASAKLGGITGGLGAAAWAASDSPGSKQIGERLRPARPAADHRALEAAGGRRPHRAAAGLPPAARLDEEALALAARSPRSRSGSGCARPASTWPTARAAGSAPTSAATRR